MNPYWSDFIQKQAANSSCDFTQVTQSDRFCLINQLAAIHVSGKDAFSFLQGQLTCDLNHLSATQGSPGGLCTAKGRLNATVLVAKVNEAYLLILPKSMLAMTLKRLKKYALFSQVELSEEAWHFILIEHQTTEASTAYSLQTLREVIQVTLPRTPHCSLYLSKKEEALINLINTHAPLTLTNESLWNYLNVLKKLAHITPNTSNLFTPQMISLEEDHGVSFSKGCYLGQEIVARTQHLGKLKRHLYQFSLNQPITINPGDNLVDKQNSAVGTVVESVAANAQHLIGLAVIEDRATDKEMFINGANVHLTL